MDIGLPLCQMISVVPSLSGATFLLSQLFCFLYEIQRSFITSALSSNTTCSRTCDLGQVSLRASLSNLMIGPECGLYL